MYASDETTSTLKGIVHLPKKEIQGFVGFSNLPNQVHRKSIKQGFAFNVMFVGESGLGKSTLVNTLFNMSSGNVKKDQQFDSSSEKTVQITSRVTVLEEANIKLKLCVLDTPGFGDYIDNSSSWQSILREIENRYDSYIEQEEKLNKSRLVDNRVHACVYFIAPTGHSLKPLDIEFMKNLHKRVNLIPVIAKSDILTDSEIQNFKAKILEDITREGINIYRPSFSNEDDEETIQEVQELLNKIPFAIMGSDYTYEIGGKMIRGRKYPWGLVEVENEQHNDFVKLRQMLIRSHLEDLKDYTDYVLYENYRTEKLLAQGVEQISLGNMNIGTRDDHERANIEVRLTKMAQEMKQVFQQKVQEKEQKLKQSEEELYAKHSQMKEMLRKQRQDLEKKKKLMMEGISDKRPAKK